MNHFYKKIIILGFITLNILKAHPLVAQNITEEEATPSTTEQLIGKILITEVNLKNSDGDWIEFLYLSPNNNALNLKGISFQDDKTFKTVEQDFFIEPNQYGALFFKKNDTDKTPKLFTPHEGLTSTTEQIVIKDKNGFVLDAVCWTSENPTTSEINEMEKLFTEKGWISSAIASCIPSATIKTGQSIIRQNSLDTNSKNDWILTNQTTPGNKNIVATDDIPTKNEVKEPEIKIADTNKEPISDVTPSEDSALAAPNEEEIQESLFEEEYDINISLAEQSTKSASTSSKSTSKKSNTSNKKTSKTPIYSNGDLSTEIVISEIMPNPEKDDNKNEWIELTNKGTKTVRIGNWQLDDIEGGSKPYTLPDNFVIEGGKVLLIPIQESKVSLGNKEDSVRLLNFEGEIVDEIHYEEAPKEQSYARIILQKENGDEEEEWRWTKDGTPDAANPVLKEITGIISEEPDFENYSFQLQTEKNGTMVVYFNESIIPGPLAKTTLIKGSEIKIVVSEKEEKIELQSYEIINTPSPQTEIGIIGPLIVTAITGGGIGWWWYRKKHLMNPLTSKNATTDSKDQGAMAESTL